MGMEALKSNKIEEELKDGSHAGSKNGDLCNLHSSKNYTKKKKQQNEITKRAAMP